MTTYCRIKKTPHLTMARMRTGNRTHGHHAVLSVEAATTMPTSMPWKVAPPVSMAPRSCPVTHAVVRAANNPTKPFSATHGDPRNMATNRMIPEMGLFKKIGAPIVRRTQLGMRTIQGLSTSHTLSGCM